MNLQKEPRIKGTKLRESAKDCPHCMSCGLENPNGDLLCLAHSNRIRDGKGRGLKSHDELGAILCANCHRLVDLILPRYEAQAMHTSAHEKTLQWWLANGYLC